MFFPYGTPQTCRYYYDWKRGPLFMDATWNAHSWMPHKCQASGKISDKKNPPKIAAINHTWISPEDDHGDNASVYLIDLDRIWVIIWDNKDWYSLQRFHKSHRTHKGSGAFGPQCNASKLNGFESTSFISRSAQKQTYPPLFSGSNECHLHTMCPHHTFICIVSHDKSDESNKHQIANSNQTNIW